MRNLVYFYTGTGNCLKLARDIAAALPECELAAIYRDMPLAAPEGCERIGIVYPVYFQGLPAIVADFLRRADFPVQGNTYYFTIGTYGALDGNATAQAAALLRERGVRLDYGTTLQMFSNCVTMYDMSRRIEAITEKSDRNTPPIIQAVAEKRKNSIPGFRRLLNWYYQKQIGRVNRTDAGFSVNDACISCGICRNVCAAGNIEMRDGRPVFLHRCEHCTACIQHCPTRAVNYKSRTQKRRRYTHPDIGHTDISRYYR